MTNLNEPFVSTKIKEFWIDIQLTALSRNNVLNEVIFVGFDENLTFTFTELAGESTVT